MGALVRKNLMVESAKIKALAELLGVSESEAVRRAVDQLLLEQEVMSAVESLRRKGGIEDVFKRPA